MQAEPKDLHGGSLFELAVRAFAKIDRRHSTAADFMTELPGAEPSGDRALRAGPAGRDLGGGASQEVLRPFARTEERHDFVLQRIVAIALPVEQIAAQIGMNVDSGEEYRAYARPSLRRHLGPSSRNNH